LRSDNHRSVLGWRRVPYLWFGSIFQFSGFAMMPFALLILSGDTWAPAWTGQISAAVSFLLVGAGMHMVQTVGLALATDLSPRAKQPKVVALLSVMLLVGMLLSAVVFGALLTPFSQIKLIQVIQGAAALTLVLNLVAVWQQEARDPARHIQRPSEPSFRAAWRELQASGPWTRRLVATGLGTFGFAMQDILLEPYGGEILGLTVGTTTLLTALFAFGGISGFAFAAHAIGRGFDANRIAGYGMGWGTMAFACVMLAAPFDSPAMFAIGTAFIGFGGGLFAHGTLTGCMQAAPEDKIGLTLGTWGAVQATSAGVAIALGGVLRDHLGALAMAGGLGPALTGPAVGYCAVYLIEILVLFAGIVAIGPLVRGSLNPAPAGETLGHSEPQTAH
jgi:BCD family chlorophyll transporter-like MFS transporter